jgi:hypothetical protein
MSMKSMTTRYSSVCVFLTPFHHRALVPVPCYQACEMNRETQDEVSAAELALHEASQTAEQVFELLFATPSPC